jgi:hypothetical protein
VDARERVGDGEQEGSEWAARVQGERHQQTGRALVLWFGLVVLVGKNLMVQMRIYDKRYIMGHLWFKAKWSSGRLVILSVWSGLVGSGLALVWLWFGSGLVLWQDQPEPSGFPDGGSGCLVALVTLTGAAQTGPERQTLPVLLMKFSPSCVLALLSATRPLI